MIAGLGSLAGYNNCAGFKPSVADSTSANSQSVFIGKACDFNGSKVPNSGTVEAFQNSTVPYGTLCVSEKRVCADGSLSGSYNFAKCEVNMPQSCLFNGVQVAHGSSVPAFQNSSVPFGQTCAQESRKCTNGALSGSFNFASCAVNSPASCMFNSQQVLHGASVPAYQNSTVPFGSTCASEARTCVNGSLSGSYTFAACSVGAPASCMFNGQQVAHGQAIPAFQSSTANFGSTCLMESRVCSNGALTGSFAYASCNVQAPASCMFNGQQIAHGQSVTAYESSSVPFGASCAMQARLCSNGALSGAFTFSSCSIGAPASCTFNGLQVAHGQSTPAFQSSVVARGQSCAREDRVCSNGTLSGSYSFGACNMAPGQSCTHAGQTFADGTPFTVYQEGATCPGIHTAGRCVDGKFYDSTGTVDMSFILPFYPYLSCTIKPKAVCNYKGLTLEADYFKTYVEQLSDPWFSPFGGAYCQQSMFQCNEGQNGGVIINFTPGSVCVPGMERGKLYFIPPNWVLHTPMTYFADIP